VVILARLKAKQNGKTGDRQIIIQAKRCVFCIAQAWGKSKCAKHGAIPGGESPLHAVEIGSASLGKGVHREMESEGSRRRNKVVTNRNRIKGYCNRVTRLWT
jgi:hypothetical protein